MNNSRDDNKIGDEYNYPVTERKTTQLPRQVYLNDDEKFVAERKINKELMIHPNRGSIDIFTKKRAQLWMENQRQRVRAQISVKYLTWKDIHERYRSLSARKRMRIWLSNIISFWEAHPEAFWEDTDEGEEGHDWSDMNDERNHASAPRKSLCWKTRILMD